MKILAVAPIGAEYVYALRTVHAVPSASAEKIRSALNRSRYNLSDGQTWHMYDINMYDSAYDIATYQKFYIHSGRIREKRCY